MPATFLASDEETELVARIYDRAGCTRPGFITGDALVEIFTNSVGLTPVVLSQIWNIADEDKTGNLSERGLAIALRLIGWAQRGEDIGFGLVTMGM
jgi:epidermal growth factor receptor substrate 15